MPRKTCFEPRRGQVLLASVFGSARLMGLPLLLYVSTVVRAPDVVWRLAEEFAVGVERPHVLLVQRMVVFFAAGSRVMMNAREATLCRSARACTSRP